MNIKGAETWVTDHPTESIVIGLGGLLVVLWALGVFKGGAASSASAGASNLAGAYYAAEAQQAVVSGQIQAATIGAAAATAQSAASDNAAVAINAANANAATIINGQNTGASVAINDSSNNAAVAINAANNINTEQLGYYGYLTSAVGSNNALLATYSNNDTAVKTNAANNSAYEYVTTSNNNAQALHDAMQTIVPQELAATGGYGNFYLPGGLFSVNTGAPTSPDALAGLGYTPAQIAGITAGQGIGA